MGIRGSVVRDSGIGGSTASSTSTGGTGGSSGTVPPGWFSVKDYGAVGDGTTDDTAAINSAITAASILDANSKTIYFPPGTYKITSTLAFTGSNGTRLLGSGGRVQFQYGPTIAYSPATGTAITAYHSTGFTLEGIRVKATSASHNGDLIDMGTIGGDTQQFQIHNCAISSAGPSASVLRMNYAIIGSISECHFGGGVIGLKVGDGNYCVGVSIRDSTFNCGLADGQFAIVTREGAESILIDSNQFEAQAGSYAGAWKHTGGVAWHVSFTNNWMGDNSLGTTAWILNDGNLFTFEVTGNRFTNATAVNVIDTTVNGTWNGGQVTGNYLDSAPIKLNPAPNTWIFGNHLPGVINSNGDYAQGQGMQPSAATPRMGFGIPAANTPQYAIDVNAGADHRCARFLAWNYMGGNPNAQDAPLGFRANGTFGFEIFGGEGAGGANNVGLLLNRTNSDFSAPTDAGVIYTIRDGDSKTRIKARDESSGTTYVGRYVRGTATWNPASVANGAITTTTVTVTNAAVGDAVAVGFPLLVAAAAAPAGLQLTGQVTSANTVTVVLRNDSGGAVDLDSGTLVAHVWKH